MDRTVNSSHLATLTAGVGIGLVLGWLLRSRLHRSLTKQLMANRSANATGDQIFNDQCLGPDCKLVIVIRNDLKMGKGKACAQCSHAAVFAYQQIRKQKSLLKLWELSGQRKVVVKVDTEAELLEIEKEAKRAGLITSLIRDAGHTQVPSGSKTVLGVGPGPQQLVDKVTGHLKLY
ncbi:peptidyl-tRNA hydrolase 2, mitochondrial-like [Oppia nitens]|uniref:peptidyl-tRNA hydrolase 2, mitochondrial-like n=1 Tax=Oppia nitens TaxID=1686743 RepID=UPI0023DA37BD|nr:peptidyl-tRNA hydrolase 2, mitochondrial-like [Oppia nitens]